MSMCRYHVNLMVPSAYTLRPDAKICKELRDRVICRAFISDKRSTTVGKHRSDSVIQITFRCKHPQAGAASVQLGCVSFISPSRSRKMWNVLCVLR